MNSIHPHALARLTTRSPGTQLTAPERYQLGQMQRVDTPEQQSPVNLANSLESSRWSRHLWYPARWEGIVTGCQLGLRYAAQFAILYLLFAVGTALALMIPLPVPGGIVGLLLLLGLLRLGVVRLSQVHDAASLVVQHLNLLFVPLVVGLMAWPGLLATYGLAIVISLVGSAAIGLIATGWVAQYLSAPGGRDATE